MNSVICLIYKQAHLTHLKSHTSTVNIFKILTSKNLPYNIYIIIKSKNNIYFKKN